ncbi:MAG: glycosyltransferase family 4 protein [Rubripirellula sp.]
MKYLIISDEYRPTIGGIARVAAAVAEHLLDRGNDVTLMTKSRTENSCERVKTKYYSRPTNSSLGKIYLTAVWPLTMGNWIRRESFDRILIIDPANALPLPILNMMGKVPYEVMLHGSELIRYSRKKSTDALFAKSLAGAERIFSTTGFVSRELKERYGHDSHLTSCGVTDAFLTDPVNDAKLIELRLRYGFSDVDFIVGTISRLDKRKGHDVVIQAIELLKATFPNIRYLIAGSGPERASLESLVERKGLQKYVVFAGRIPEEELVDHYDLMNAYAMPNRLLQSYTVEGFGISFAEAAARGVPSIGVDNGGVGEAIDDGVSGYLLATPDPEQVASSIAKIATGESAFDINQIQDHGRKFTWESVVDRIVDAHRSA